MLPGTETCMGIPEIVMIGGLDSDLKGKITEGFNFNTENACDIASFFESTSREGLDDGVWRGMVCDHVHGESICCGGEFGVVTGDRVLLQKDCMSLERTSWTNSTVDPLPLALRFPSSTLFNNGTDDLWLVTGGEGKALKSIQRLRTS